MPSIETKEGKLYSMDGYLFKLLSGLQEAVLNHNSSAVIICDGRSGLGKTTISIQMAFKLSPNFNIDKIFYEPDSFLEGLARAQKGDCLIFDEAMLISSRSTLSKINKMIIIAMSMIRSKQVFVIFCCNSIFDLDRNLALSRADLLIHVFGNNLLDRGNFLAFFKPKGNFECRIKTLYLLGKQMYSYSKPQANFHGVFYKPFLIDEEEYEKRKQIAINKFLMEGALRLPKRDKYLYILVKHLRDYLNYNVLKIAELLSCSHQTIYNILQEKELEDKEESLIVSLT